MSKQLLLTARDRDTLVLVYRHGMLLRDHLHQLAFPDCELRRANRRLQILKAHGLLVAFPLPLGTFAAGFNDLLPSPAQSSYRLGEVGIPLVSAMLELDIQLVRRRVRCAPTYCGHCVAVAALHTSLRRFQEAQEYRLQSFLCESEARSRFEWRETPQSPWKQGEIRPDALAWIEQGGEKLPLLFEADMSSQNIAALLAKFLAYRVAAPFLKKRFEGALPRLAIVTTSPARLTKIAAVLKESELAQPGNGFHTVAVATFHDFVTQGPSASIWTLPLSGEATQKGLF